MTTGVNTNMTTTTADCELLGRGPVQGSADSDSLAALVRQLCKQQQRDRLPGRRCTVSCSRDVGLEIVPYVQQQQQQQQQQHQHQHQHQQQHRKRPDDEGFESDEDLASLGSYEDPNKRKTGTLAAASAAAGASSDSANSSGVSEDSDDADAASLKGQPQTAATETAPGGGGGGRETYGLADVAFCHTDAVALPGVAVWVIKTRRTSVAGLEAIVVRCCRDNRLQNVCRAYQEHSRRLKLEPKPWTGLHVHGNSAAGAGVTSSPPAALQRRGKVVGSGGNNVTLTAAPEVNRYSLVQRTDTDGVTHIEVTAGPPCNAAASPSARRVTGGRRDGSPSSIISISTPESPSRKVPSGRDRCSEDGDRDDDDDDGGDGGGGGGDRPPQRPERRKYKAKPEDGRVSDDFGRQQKVVRGQFIRVNVNHQCAVNPEPERKSTRPREPPSAAGGAPCTSTPSSVAASDRLWSTADYDRLDGRYEQHRRSSRPANAGRTRSRSTGPGRRQQQQQQQQQQQPLQLTAAGHHPPPVAFSRYPPAAVEPQTIQSFGARFFGKLRDMTSANQDAQPVTFRRRNSVGESATANFYQYFGHQHRQQQHHYGQYQQQQQDYHQRQQVKNGGNLKSVIKKSNKSQPYQHAYDEPKKVTFSAYATVQVVD